MHLNNNNYENDDLVTFQLDSKTLNFYYSQLVKYSKRIRDSYLFSDATQRFPQELSKFYEEFQVSSENIICFFQILQQNCNINDESILTYIQCLDLLKISKYLEIRKLSDLINGYIKSQRINVDFVIQMIHYETKTSNEAKSNEIDISSDIENVLSEKIDDCLLNEKFSELPISIIYRIIEKSSTQKITSDVLYDFIKKSISKFCVLFPFLDLQKISKNRLDELCDVYSKADESSLLYFNYLKCNLNVLNDMRNNNKNLQEKLVSFEKKNDELESLIMKLKMQIEDKEKADVQQQEKLNDLETQINQMQVQLKESVENFNEIQSKLKESEKINQKIKEEKNQIQKQFEKSEKEKNRIQKQFENSEKEKSQIQKHFKEEIIKIKGEIFASVKNGLLISAKINLTSNGESLDTNRSKYIISTSDAETLGVDAYEKGELITSLQMNTIDFLCKSGTYYVRCIIFNSQGLSNEIVSNSVSTSGSCATFQYEGKPSKFSLFKGKYKLEVWGAKGGDSTGKKHSSNPPGEGGLGGYSSGILNLKENEIVHVFVGGEGKSANSSDGATTNGGFPDGGGTKTGHWSSCTSVPGTGGGSTSIRIRSDTDYARVIVAGGGGGASGCCVETNSGGFGGGLCGGDCIYERDSSKHQGAGTQTGSTCGLGLGSDGDPGSFGHGAAGKYLKGRDSGGGGGGGWYGGGSGGYGSSSRCSSGGGGSGWTFTSSSFSTWLGGDPSNSSKFLLDSTYQLSEAVCMSGDQNIPSTDGNGTEKGHQGNGFAKITPV